MDFTRMQMYCVCKTKSTGNNYTARAQQILQEYKFTV